MYYLLTFNEDYADEHDVPALDCKTEKQFDKWLERDLRDDFYATLGNGGEGFVDQFDDCATGQDFIDGGYVEVTEVDESFYTIFHKAGLNNLSLCTIFN